MVKAANVTTVEEAVDYFCRRFLRVDLQSQRRAAVIDFLKQELDSDTLDYDNEALEHALRRARSPDPQFAGIPIGLDFTVAWC